MNATDYKRIARSGFVNFTRSKVISLAAILVVSITLFVIVSLIFLQAILQSSLAQIKENVDVTAYFSQTVSEERIGSIKTSLERLPEVKEVIYTSAEDNLNKFRARHENDYLTLRALDELDENPLQPTLTIKAVDTADYESIVKFLDNANAPAAGGSQIIDRVDYQKNKKVIDRLNNMIAGAQELGFIVTLVLVAISIIITFNTIRLTIYISREEIGIMRLVGASNRYIRGPFMVEGIIYGLISSIFTIVLFFPITIWFAKNMTPFLGIDLFTYYTSNFFQVFFITLGSGIFLGSISSWLAVKKYLKK